MHGRERGLYSMRVAEEKVNKAKTDVGRKYL